MVVPLLLLVLAQDPATRPADPPRASDARLERIQREVRHELATLPRYGVFDHLAFKVERDAVTLLGHVRRGSLKEDAEKAVRAIEGVETVRNQIELLPASVGDDAIRLAVYRAIYRDAGLERYALQNNPPIHIVVSGGRVTLEGVVATPLDKQLAATRAREVGSVTQVTDNLVVDKSRSNDEP
jgi:osmotically-inducible protein OsmY